MAHTIRNLIPSLPRRVWVVLLGDGFSAIGGGLVLPFLIVYLHKVRGFSLPVAGLMLSTLAVVGLAGGPIAGWIVDKIGSRRALILSLAISAVGSLGLASVTEVWQGFAVCAVFGLGQMFLWPAIHSLLVSIVSEKQRSAVFSVHYATINAGIGIGGIVGGLVADVSRPSTFEWLYIADSATFIVFIAILWRLKDIGLPLVASAGDESSPKVGYRQVIKDKVFVRMLALGSLLVVIGYSQLESGFPAFVTREGGVSTRVLGFAFAANTAVIVVSQLVVLKKLAGKRRTRAIAVMALLWAVAWLIVLISNNVGIHWVAVMGAVLGMSAFALGETFMSPTMPAIVNDLAPDDLRGRYNALYSTSWAVGHIIGPAIAGWALGADLGNAFFGGLVVACLGAAYLAISMERHLPMSANRVAESDLVGTGVEDEEPVQL